MDELLITSWASSLGMPLSTRANIIFSAITRPFCASIFSSILSLSTTSLDITRSHFVIMSSSNIIECERVNLSDEELAKSLSCQSKAFS